ncbi:MAG TPA: TonB-dependent receptor [Gemmatimonadales bacterium]|nr:TonB-dependent receptor [Gemmatimonadales bacterium]
MRLTGLSRLGVYAVAIAFLASGLLPRSLAAQGTGGVSGAVTRSDDQSPLGGVIVLVKGTTIRTATNTSGRYTLERIPAGAQTIEFRWVGYAPRELEVTIGAGSMATLDAQLEPLPVTLSEIMVSGASRAPERVTQAPAAIFSVEPRALVTASAYGQAPLALRNVPGVDLTQSGLTDFNVNARGFNSTLNRRVLVLQDGRDLAIAFLGSQEWNTMTQPTEDFSKMEFVSGPGSALYGANAYSGVLDITTPTAREVLGTKVTVAGGLVNSVLNTEDGWQGGSPAGFRGDLRHAGTFSQGKFGYRINFGASRSDTWSRSRTLRDSTSLRLEYNGSVGCANSDCPGASDSIAPKRAPERLALRGQTIDAGTGEALGDRDPISSYYGGARFDYYAANGNVATLEGGYAKVQNEVFVTGIGRVQVYDAARPWLRAEYAATGYNVMAYWNGRRTNEPQYSLASSAPLLEHSDIMHVEAQANRSFSNDRGRLVYGASIRNLRLDTDSTLMIARDDDRSDFMYAAYAQMSWQLNDQTRFVLAGRFDLGSLIDPQFSPKAALVVNPSENHSIRFTVNQAFQTPNYSEYFLRAAAGLANLSLLEAGLRASPLGPALAGVPDGQLFSCSNFATPCAGSSSQVLVSARGNSRLDVEKNTGFELGWRGDLSRRVFASVDAYYNLLSNFVTDLLPGVNPAFGRWTAPAEVPAPFRPALESAVRNALLANPASRVAGLGLTRQETGNTAIVLSYANAGKAKQKGVDAAVGFQASEAIRFDLAGSWFTYDVDQDEVAAGDLLLANTPKWRSNFAVNYAGRSGLDAGLNYRYSSGFQWAAGIFAGWIEPGHNVDGNVGYRVSPQFRVFLTGTNLFNRQWFSIYGGSVNGRRLLGGVTATF